MEGIYGHYALSNKETVRPHTSGACFSVATSSWTLEESSPQPIERTAPATNWLETRSVAINMFTLDTNAIIYFLQDDSAAVAVIAPLVESPVRLFASTITELELLSFQPLTDDEFQAIDDLLRTLTLVPVDSQIARLAGELRRHKHIEVPDSIIAATALLTKSTLLTRNVRDFRNIPTLSIQTI